MRWEGGEARLETGVVLHGLQAFPFEAPQIATTNHKQVDSGKFFGSGHHGAGFSAVGFAPFARPLPGAFSLTGAGLPVTLGKSLNKRVMRAGVKLPRSP
jgi:hypothetical protein